VAVARSVPGDKAVRNQNIMKIIHNIRKEKKGEVATLTTRRQKINEPKHKTLL
jgi:hypothetical protein